MNKMRINDYKLLKESLELAGLNENQVRLILQKVEWAVDNAVRDASNV